MNQGEFIEYMGELAQKDWEVSRILPSLTVAQGILESGWGKSDLAVTGKNLFGMKANSSWTGKVYNATTKECYDGENLVDVSACFKAYTSWEASISDHSALFTQNKRYEKVVGETDYKKACQEVKNAGYATDPDYVSKLISLIEQYKLYEFDPVSDGKESFGEESEEHWAEFFENKLIEEGIITARKSLDEAPSRGELYVMIYQLLGLKEGENT